MPSRETGRPLPPSPPTDYAKVRRKKPQDAPAPEDTESAGPSSRPEEGETGVVTRAKGRGRGVKKTKGDVRPGTPH